MDESGDVDSGDAIERALKTVVMASIQGILGVSGQEQTQEQECNDPDVLDHQDQQPLLEGKKMVILGQVSLDN